MTSNGMFTGTITGGILMELRDLTTKDGGRVWRSVAKIAFTGGVCDATTDGLNTSGFTIGDQVDATGHWCDGGMGKQHFLLTNLSGHKVK